MRTFIAACCVIIVTAIAAAAALDSFVQEPVSVAFARPSVRL
jgi:hypothetical protein